MNELIIGILGGVLTELGFRAADYYILKKSESVCLLGPLKKICI
jgi:hypothetical protein